MGRVPRGHLGFARLIPARVSRLIASVGIVSYSIYLLHFVVIRPVVRIADIANEVSLGKPDVPEYVRPGQDEISSLSQSFNRMRLSLENAMKMLGE